MASKTKSTRGKVWSEEETTFLLTCWSEETIQIALDNSKCTKDTNRVYRNLLMQMKEKGYEDLTLEQIVNKMKKLRQKYKTEKDKTRKSGHGKPRKWKHFDQMDNILSQKHNVTPVSIIDTMDKPEDDNECDLVESLMDKYGEGKKFVRKCQTCDYEQVIHTGGVHTPEGGSLMVYDDDDNFSCPNCDFEASIGVDYAKPDDDHTEQDGDDASVNVIMEDDDEEEKSKKDEKENEVQNLGKNNKNATQEKKDGGKSKPKLSLGSKKRKSGVEKSLEVVFDKFKQASSEDFERYRKLEEMRLEKEHKFLREQAILESERRKQEREHELNMLSMLMGQASQINQHAVHAPNLHGTNAVYHANPPIKLHDIVTEQDKTYFQF